MRLLQIAYDVDTGTVIRAALEGRDLSKEVTVTLTGEGRDHDESTSTAKESAREVSAVQAQIAAAFSRQDTPLRSDEDHEQESRFDWSRPGAHS